MILDTSVKIVKWKANYQRMKLITYLGDFVSDLGKIENFVLNNMGNKEMMMLVGLRETAQTYYLKCEKLEAENTKLKDCLKQIANEDYRRNRSNASVKAYMCLKELEDK